MTVRIHDVQAAAPPFRSRIDAAAPVIPASATRPAVWEAALGILRQQAPEPATCFIHRDFQLFNLLWRRGRLTGSAWLMKPRLVVQPRQISPCRS
jgi:aminoglycoside phosphotransferase (APT) family kinase protein